MAERKRKAAEPATTPVTDQASKFKKTVDDSASEFLCPITQELPIDPVTAEDGRVYERSAIEEWLEKNEKSPHTNEPMGKRLLPALQVKNMIETMVKSGALSTDKCAAWTQKLEQEKEVEELRQRAEAGDVRAMTGLAFKYDRKGKQEDLAAHFQWAKRAADLDDATGMTMLAVCYLHGKGTTKNERAGLIALGQAAALGSEHACYVLANSYHHGTLYGLKKDSAQFTHWAAKMRRNAGNGKCDCPGEHRARIAGYANGDAA